MSCCAFDNREEKNNVRLHFDHGLMRSDGNVFADLSNRLQTVNPECEEEKQSEYEKPDVKEYFVKWTYLTQMPFRLGDWPDFKFSKMMNCSNPLSIYQKKSTSKEEQIKRNQLNKGTIASATEE